LIERARSQVRIRRRTVADDEGMPPLPRTTRDRHPLPTTGFRVALAKRASGESRPARAVFVRSESEIIDHMTSARTGEADVLLLANRGSRSSTCRTPALCSRR